MTVEVTIEAGAGGSFRQIGKIGSASVLHHRWVLDVTGKKLAPPHLRFHRDQGT